MGAVNKLEAQNILSRSISDPDFFLRNILGKDAWQKQIEIMESVRDNKRTSCRSCHGIGKTACAAWTILWFLYTHPDSVVVNLSPTWRQTEQLIWREIRSAHAQTKYPLGGTLLNTRLDLGPTWYAIGVSADKPENVQGYHAKSGHILFVYDEASGIDQDIFDASQGSLASEGSRLLLIGNPTQTSGEFYESFRSPLYHTIHISAFDTPNFTDPDTTHFRPYLITPDWVEDKRKAWGEDSPLWDSRVLGDFPRSSDDTLISLVDIEKAQLRFSEPLDATKPIRLGVDVARFGSDSTIITKSQGLHASVIKTITKMDTMVVSGEVVDASRSTGATHINVDVGGLGAGVVDRLTELKMPVLGINSSSSPIDKEAYINLRAELYCNLRDEFKAGTIAIDPHDKELEAELSSLKYKFTSAGKYQIESKEEIKKRSGGKSPDRADSLCLSRYAKVKPSLKFHWPQG